MFEISNDYPIPEPGLGHRGLAQTMRDMRKGDSVELPLTKRGGIYSAAKAASAKIRIRATGKGTIRVWRIDGAERSIGKAVVGVTFAGATGSVPLASPKTSTVETARAQGGTYVRSAYGPSVFVADEDIFGQPIKPNILS
jgi:hypothetical protein